MGCSGWLFQLSLEVPPPLMFPMTVTPLGRDQDCSLKIREPDVPASWFLDPGGWSKTAAVSLYFIFPGICTLSLVSIMADVGGWCSGNAQCLAVVLLEDHVAAKGSLTHTHLSVRRHRAETGHSAARTCGENLQLSTGKCAKTDALGPAESTWGLETGELVPVPMADFSKPPPYV
ncbi:hypothetical protein STEG23_000863 [Scotinomys teguina]